MHEKRDSGGAVLGPAMLLEDKWKPTTNVDVKSIATKVITNLRCVRANKINMKGGGDAYDEDEDDGPGMRAGPGGAQCQQM